MAGVIEPGILENDFTASDFREKSRPILYAIAAAKRALKDSFYETRSTDKLEDYGRNLLDSYEKCYYKVTY